MDQDKERSSGEIINLSEKQIYIYNDNMQKEVLKKKQWLEEYINNNFSSTYFKKVMLSTLAVLKIVDHAVRAQNFEICGYMTGFVKNDTFYVLDAYELPILGESSKDEIAGILGNNAYEYNNAILGLASLVRKIK